MQMIDNLVQRFLPKFKNTEPVHISLALILYGAFTALIFFFSTYFPFLYLLAIILIFFRMCLEKLDEQVALTYQKQSTKAELLNLISPELADILLMIGILLADFDYMGIGILAMGVCWAMILFDLAGLIANHEVKRKGPMQDPYRMFVLMGAAFLQIFAQIFHWPIDFIYLFLIWIIVGGLTTLVIKWRALFRES